MNMNNTFTEEKPISTDSGNEPSKTSKYVEKLFKAFPSLNIPLEHIRITNAYLSIQVIQFEAERKILFYPEEQTLGSAKPFKCLFTQWLNLNPSQAQQDLIWNTLKEIAFLYSVIRENTSKLPTSDVSAARKCDHNLHEAVIRLREIFYNDKGLWGARYGDEVMVGFEDFLYRCSRPFSNTSFLHRVVLGFSNGFRKDFITIN